MVRQAVPLQPVEDDGEQRFDLQPVEDSTPEQVEVPEGGCDFMGNLRSWQDLWPHGERSPRWSRFAGRTVTPWGTHAGAVREELQPVGRTHVGEGPHAGAGEECEEPYPDEQGAAETPCDELTTTPIPQTTVLLVGRR
ncbi:AN1-type zinc finger protein 5-like [Grus japonensis]|uniref:AN1-type zinc finger protein 5-like n=1 Tax=Grus japonensis TaxID=30415 RepID=A0ABC9W9D3_GRUJA